VNAMPQLQVHKTLLRAILLHFASAAAAAAARVDNLIDVHSHKGF